jgi:murein DD-endopeptidase MepM/ murein hydrolase activator NlpD
MHPRILLALVALVLLVGTALAPGSGAAARAPGPLPEPLGVWPLTPVPEVLAGFDPPDQPWGAGHRGVDLAGSPGQVVRAALAGTVRFAGRLAGRGVVVVDHGDTRTTDEPVLATLAVGNPVARGQPIGTLDLAGGHCLPRACLHWGWLRGDVYLDPLDLVGAGPVRLLPLWRDFPAPLQAGQPLVPWPFAGWWPAVLLLTPAGAPAGRPSATDRW